MSSIAAEMKVGAARPSDAAFIDGSPGMELEITAGVPGDAGTASVVISYSHVVGKLEPGLRTMLDVPLLPPVGSLPGR